MLDHTLQIYVVKYTLLTLQWEVLLYTVYSSDCAPSDYYLFRSMQHLAKQHFKIHEEKKNGSNELIVLKDKFFFTEFIYCQKMKKSCS